MTLKPPNYCLKEFEILYRFLLESSCPRILTRFIMKNAKLYSCTLSYPDPDGDRRRYWENLAWHEGLFHRSGQWDRG